MNIDIPGIGLLMIDTVILDLNGTLAVDGKVIEGAAERIQKLKELSMAMYLFTGNSNGNGAEVAKQLGLKLFIAADGHAKAEEAKKLQPDTTATIGNGRIDLELFRIVRLRIATLQAEGIYATLLLNTDIVVPSINDALDLFLHKKRLIGTLRK
jgi:soluble P-type ATPase